MVLSKSQDSFVRFHQSPLTESPRHHPSMIFKRTWAILAPLYFSGVLSNSYLVFRLELKLPASFKCSEQMQTYCKGCCFHPERVDAHMRTAEATAWGKKTTKKKLAVSIFKRISLFLFFLISLPRSSAFSVLWHVFCTYVFACLNVRSCARVHVASLRSQKTLSVNTGEPGSSGLGFSDSLLCYLHVVCPAPDERHLSPSLFCLSSFS